MPEEEGNETETVIEAVRRLARLVAEHGLSELAFEEGGLSVVVKATAAASAHPHLVPVGQTPTHSQTAVTTPSPPDKSARSATAVALESPMVGVFYRTPSPDDPPFVSVGDLVKVGQTVGMIEAMKVYSEVPSEVAGRVVELPVENGKLVQQGQPLIYVEPQ